MKRVDEAKAVGRERLSIRGQVYRVAILGRTAEPSAEAVWLRSQHIWRAIVTSRRSMVLSRPL